MKNGRKLSRSGRQNLVLLVLLVALVAFFTVTTGRFLTVYNIMTIIRQNVPNVIIACAMCFVISSGAIDLSIGGVMALSAVVYGKLCVAGLNPWLSVVIVAVMGVGIGCINNIITEKLAIPAIMSTMATWLASAGIALTITKAIPISDPEVKPITILNQLKVEMFGDKIAIVPIIIVVLVVAVFVFLEKRTIIGKYAKAIGGNSNAAHFSGINVTRMRMIFFSLCACMAAISGVWQVARVGTADPKFGTGMEFNVISACILGGVNIKGGEGTILGVVTGTYLLAILTNGMQMMNIDTFYQQVVIGVVLLGAVLLNVVTSLKSNKKKAVAVA